MLKNTPARRQTEPHPRDDAAKEKTFAEKLAEDVARGEMLVGIDQVAAFYGVSLREVHRWQESSPDFPVDKSSGRWVTCRERLEAWREEHLDKFLSRQDMQEEHRRRERRW